MRTWYADEKRLLELEKDVAAKIAEKNKECLELSLEVELKKDAYIKERKKYQQSTKELNTLLVRQKQLGDRRTRQEEAVADLEQWMVVMPGSPAPSSAKSGEDKPREEKPSEPMWCDEV